jgi:hypothetical protein
LIQYDRKSIPGASDLPADGANSFPRAAWVGCMKRYLETVLVRTGASLVVSLGLGVNVSVGAGAMAADRLHQNPATTEDVQLRSACAARGEQILEGNFIRSAVYQEQFSRFSPRTNRCYVEMRVQTGDLNENSDRFAQYLYDGQTREMLAFAQIQNGKKSGKVFDLHHRTTSFENAGWDDASEYIYTTMAGERR